MRFTGNGGNSWKKEAFSSKKINFHEQYEKIKKTGKTLI
jgi:hypothetical protein